MSLLYLSYAYHSCVFLTDVCLGTLTHPTYSLVEYSVYKVGHSLPGASDISLLLSEV